jgi:hypothetical protein
MRLKIFIAINIKNSVFSVTVCLLKTAQSFPAPLPLIFSLFYLSDYISLFPLLSLFFLMLFLFLSTFFFLYHLKVNLCRLTLFHLFFFFPPMFIPCVLSCTHLLSLYIPKYFLLWHIPLKTALFGATGTFWYACNSRFSLPIPISVQFLAVIAYFSPMKMEAANSSETLVSLYQSMWCHISEDHIILILLNCRLFICMYVCKC